MALRVLEINIKKSMECNIDFNGERGFEISDGPYQHTVDLRNRTCSCRAWMLKGIPCQHALAAILYKKYEPIEFVDSCYSKETYLRTYCHFLQPVTNMKMWPESNNPYVAPPVVKPMPMDQRRSGEEKPLSQKDMHIRSADVIGDLGHKARTGVRWKGQAAMTSSQLEEMRVKKRKKVTATQNSQTKDP
ncbi:uncharacterized protein LOC132034673 [Lycium ferocissimum]|uniref:uncharacterized protein LOC132034673 n=1 Tax=Lycium ferocissimum TaxID=112874 RepID=UPI0028152EDD|nr:uncharacterized protein LOC132034673 [Lycium ferocissimum]